MDDCNISTLCGAKMLTGIDRYNEVRPTPYSGDQDVEVCRIELDGVIYEFYEDPNDGYRSGHLGPSIIEGSIANKFPAVPVVGSHVEQAIGSYADGADVLRLVNASTGKTILEVGTDNVDDYYPSWICNFSAENIGPLHVEPSTDTGGG